MKASRIIFQLGLFPEEEESRKGHLGLKFVVAKGAWL